MIPARQRCLELLDIEQMPEHIKEHSRQVARVSLRIGAALNEHAGARLDLALLEAGGLLHDIRKIFTIENGGDHARLGAEFVISHGYDEVAPLIARHVHLGPVESEGLPDEAEVINYADKRVLHEDIVSLEERFEYLFERYGKTEAAHERLVKLRAMMDMVENKIFSRIPLKPSEVG